MVAQRVLLVLLGWLGFYFLSSWLKLSPDLQLVAKGAGGALSVTGVAMMMFSSSSAKSWVTAFKIIWLLFSFFLVAYAVYSLYRLQISQGLR